MRIRIPAPVNEALDAVGRRQRLVAVAVVSAAVGALAVAAVMDELAAGLGAAGIGALLLLGAMSRARESRLREQIRQAEYELAAERRENERLRVGDPSAPTAQLRSIGESGELT